MKTKDQQIINYIFNYCEDINSTIKRLNSDFELFMQDRDMYNSISMSILQIGELSDKLSDEFIEENNGFPWKLIKEERNKIAHSYMRKGVEGTWDFAVEQVPKLQEYLKERIT